MSKIRNGEILIEPRKVFWVGMPSRISQTEILDLLKQDLLLLNWGANDYAGLPVAKNDLAAYMFNLDTVLETQLPGNIRPKRHQNPTQIKAEMLAEFILANCSDTALVHTTTIDATLSQIFRSRHIAYIEKNLNDRTLALNALLKVIQPLFDGEKRKHRAHIRVEMADHEKYRIELKNLTDNGRRVTGYLRDISLGGMSFSDVDSDKIELIELKDLMQVKVYFPQHLLKIDQALVTRINRSGRELGIHFDINDSNMVSDDSSNYIAALVHEWLQEFLQDQYKKLAQ